MKKIIELYNVNKFVDGKFILRDVSFSIEYGDCLFILGPSGCGKTTLLKILSGLTEKSSGIIKIYGKDFSFFSIEDRKMSTVFSDFYLFEDLTVYENIEFGIDENSTDIEKKHYVEEMSMILGIDEILELKVYNLSSGQKQRVAIARAIVNKPNIVLMDEPFCYLDICSKKVIFEDFIKLKKFAPKITYIIVSHSYEEALAIGTKTAIMEKGKIVYFGDKIKPYDNPVNIITAELTGKIVQINAVLHGFGINNDIFLSLNNIIFNVQDNNFLTYTKAKIGDKLIILIRPENIIIKALEEGLDMFKNNLTGIVKDIRMFLAFVEYIVFIDCISTYIISSELKNNIRKNIMIGTKVLIELKPNKIIVESDY